jgi:hypothetical protein
MPYQQLKAESRAMEVAGRLSKFSRLVTGLLGGSTRDGSAKTLAQLEEYGGSRSTQEY